MRLNHWIAAATLSLGLAGPVAAMPAAADGSGGAPAPGRLSRALAAQDLDRVTVEYARSRYQRVYSGYRSYRYRYARPYYARPYRAARYGYYRPYRYNPYRARYRYARPYYYPGRAYYRRSYYGYPYYYRRPAVGFYFGF